MGIIQKMNPVTASRRRGLFVTDLDGTLLNDNRRVNPIDFAALQQLREDGFVTAAATGRSDYSLAGLQESLLVAGAPGILPVDFIIFSTGAGIMRHPEGDLLWSNNLTRDDLDHIIARLEGYGVDFMVHRPIPETRRFFYRLNHEDNGDFQRRLHMYRQWAEPLPACLPPDLAGATEVLCIAPEESGHALAEQISKALPACSVIKATSPLDHRSLWIEIFAAGVSKSHGVAWLAKRLGLVRKRVGVVGNDYNDVDMLGWTKHAYVVANSPDDMQRRYWCVAANNEGGVAEAVTAWRSALGGV